MIEVAKTLLGTLVNVVKPAAVWLTKKVPRALVPLTMTVLILAVVLIGVMIVEQAARLPSTLATAAVVVKTPIIQSVDLAPAVASTPIPTPRPRPTAEFPVTDLVSLTNRIKITAQFVIPEGQCRQIYAPIMPWHRLKERLYDFQYVGRICSSGEHAIVLVIGTGIPGSNECGRPYEISLVAVSEEQYRLWYDAVSTTRRSISPQPMPIDAINLPARTLTVRLAPEVCARR